MTPVEALRLVLKDAYPDRGRFAISATTIAAVAKVLAEVEPDAAAALRPEFQQQTRNQAELK